MFLRLMFCVLVAVALVVVAVVVVTPVGTQVRLALLTGWPDGSSALLHSQTQWWIASHRALRMQTKSSSRSSSTLWTKCLCPASHSCSGWCRCLCPCVLAHVSVLMCLMCLCSFVSCVCAHVSMLMCLCSCVLVYKAAWISLPSPQHAPSVLALFPCALSLSFILVLCPLLPCVVLLSSMRRPPKHRYTPLDTVLHCAHCTHCRRTLLMVYGQPGRRREHCSQMTWRLMK